MTKAALYREEAARLRRWEAVVTDPLLRRQVRAMAESYEKLALKADARKKPRDPNEAG